MLLSNFRSTPVLSPQGMSVAGVGKKTKKKSQTVVTTTPYPHRHPRYIVHVSAYRRWKSPTSSGKFSSLRQCFVYIELGGGGSTILHPHLLHQSPCHPLTNVGRAKAWEGGSESRSERAHETLSLCREDRRESRGRRWIPPSHVHFTPPFLF